MPSPAGEYSLDHHLLEHFKFSGLAQENLADLVSILVSLKDKYGITPFGAVAVGQPVPKGVTAHYLMDSITLRKMINVLVDTFRIKRITLLPRGIPKSAQFEVKVTLGG